MSTSLPVLRPWWRRAAWSPLFKVSTWRAKTPPCPPRTSPTSCHRSSAATRYVTRLTNARESWQFYRSLLCDRVDRIVFVPQDCLRSCQEQIESLLESSLRQAQQHSGTTETKRVDEDVDLSCTPTDVRDINIWEGVDPAAVASRNEPDDGRGDKKKL